MYDLQWLADRTIDKIRTNPRTTILAVAELLQVERHTINRAIRQCLGLPPRVLRNQCLREWITEYHSAHPNSTAKEAASALGYTPSSFARVSKRLLGLSPRARCHRPPSLRASSYVRNHRSA
jgi:AraC-like DNA-binding protein